MNLLRSRARVVAVVAVVMGLFAGGTPKASAIATGNFSFVGRMNLSGGLDYPCANPESKPCPPSVLVVGPVSKKTPPLVVNGNTRTGTLFSDVCIGGVQNVNKPGKAASEGPICSLTATFTLTGYCGLATASGTGRFVTTPGQLYFFNFTFTILGTKLALRGNYWKHFPTKPVFPEGDFVINADVNNDVSTLPTNSCVNKTARLFLVTGSGHLVHPKTMS